MSWEGARKERGELIDRMRNGTPWSPCGSWVEEVVVAEEEEVVLLVVV
jgi:hypothetical protein